MIQCFKLVIIGNITGRKSQKEKYSLNQQIFPPKYKNEPVLSK